MQKILNFAGFSFLLLLIHGCWNDNDKVHIDYSNLKQSELKGSPLVKASNSTINNYIKNGIRLRLLDNGYVTTDANINAADSAVLGNVSSTNVHETGVDEADRVKYDGEYLYVQNSPYYTDTNQTNNNQIKVMKTNALTATTNEVARINVASENLIASELYLLKDADILVSIAKTEFGWLDLYVDDDWRWNSGKTQIQLFDVTTPEAPIARWKLEIEGNLQGSRRVGDILYLVTQYLPNIEGLNYNAETDAEKRQNELLIRSAKTADLLPHYQTNDGAINNLVDAQDCLVADNLEVNEGLADIVTLTAINLVAQQVVTSQCLNTNLSGIYSSLTGFYLGGSSFDNSWFPSSELTVLHKFALNGGNISYSASAALPGYLAWQDPAFRMSEYQGVLRVITTDLSEGWLNPKHQLFVLRDNGSDQLEQVASLPNAAQPEAIGKPGEDIFAVRFAKEKAYVVTFERTDPLYVLDLSEHEAPFIAGALEILGFSRYLHALSDDWLLGVGNEVEGANIMGVKVELYDIRDMSAPKLQDKLVFGEQYSHSDVLSDLRSLSLLNLDNGNSRLALPMDIWQKNEATNQPQWSRSGLFLFEINTTADNELNLVHSSEILAEEASELLIYPVNSGLDRSKLHDDSVFYLHGNEVLSRKWNVID